MSFKCTDCEHIFLETDGIELTMAIQQHKCGASLFVGDGLNLTDNKITIDNVSAQMSPPAFAVGDSIDLIDECGSTQTMTITSIRTAGIKSVIEGDI